MIPALTGYGFEVVRATDRATTAVTTGHAATAVSVVKTVHAALAVSGRDLGDLTVAMVGLGSIGTSSLNLLLTRAPRPPAHLVLCDVAGSGYAERSWLPGTVASCRLESLLHTAVSGLPLVHGLVNASHAHAYWDAVEAAGVSAAPPHLLGHTIATGPPWHGTTSHGTS